TAHATPCPSPLSLHDALPIWPVTRCDAVLEAHLPPVDLPAYRSALLGAWRERGEVQKDSWASRGSRRRMLTGSIAVDGLYAPVGRDDVVHARRLMVGVPVSTAQPGSSITAAPGTPAQPLRHAEAVALRPGPGGGAWSVVPAARLTWHDGAHEHPGRPRTRSHGRYRRADHRDRRHRIRLGEREAARRRRRGRSARPSPSSRGDPRRRHRHRPHPPRTPAAGGACRPPGHRAARREPPLHPPLP